MTTHGITLEGKTVLFTGGFGILGQGVVPALLRAGAQVRLLDIAADDEKLQNFRKISNAVTFHQGDITDADSITKLVGEISKAGKIDVLVNNAYPRNQNYGRRFEDITWEDWCDNVNTHLGGYFNVTQKVAAAMQKQKSGSIINMGSIYGVVGPDFSIYEGTTMTMPAEYAAIKGGLINFTRYLATYLAPYQIRVNAVSPGGIFNGQDERFVKRYEANTPLGRMGSAQDITGAIIYLASEASSYMTGQNLIVDGGWTAW